MKPSELELGRTRYLTGFGASSGGVGYLYRPSSMDEIRAVFEIARSTGRKVALRGSARSYGDANYAAEEIVLDLTRMNRVLSWDRASGRIHCEAGVTLEQLWRYCLEDGFWPPVVTGTMHPTLGGALSMNVHGKNNYCQGTLGEHVEQLEVLLPSGELLTLSPHDDRFFQFISSAGLLGVIVGVHLKMHPVASGLLSVYAESPKNWDAQFALFERFEEEADYMVSWVDCFASGPKSGRGQFHSATYTKTPHMPSLDAAAQDLPALILGFFPKSLVWKVLRLLCHRPGMRTLNWAKHAAGAALGNAKTHTQSLVEFSFLLDYVPDWRKAYAPHGFIQYQSFVPKAHARRVFAEQVRLQQEAKLESFLGVLKRHRSDSFLFSHGVDGYSLALDFKVTPKNRERLWKLCHRMNQLVIVAGGKFYLAKDSTLTSDQFAASIGSEQLAKFYELKQTFDPEHLLTSDQAKRLHLA